MKPVTLTMQAFGSYLKRTELDFRLLGDNPIFLITGATGGGKTTILDAMCFALYCKATGGRRSWDSMRCAAAPQGAETMVDFVFQLSGETYRFTRAQSQYKARGTGVLKTKETHACYRMENGEWSLLLAGAESRVREKAEEILGLTCEQFSQVIVLPQGDFLKLLLSSSREKAQMFQTLFATGRWEQAVHNLKEMAARLGKEAGELEAAKRSILEREGVETLPLLEEREAVLREELAKAKAAQLAASVALQKQNGALRAAEALAEQFTALERQKIQAHALEQQREDQEKKRQKLALARRAAGVYPYFTAYRSAQKDLLTKRQAYTDAKQQLAKAEAEQNAAQKQLPLAERYRAGLSELAKEEERLQGFRENACKRQELREKQKELAQRFVLLEKQRKEAQERLKTADRQVADGNAYIENALQQSALLPKLLEDVQGLIKEDAAASLATQLQQGIPCPVCGSVQHPRPAQRSTRLQEAQNALQQAQKAASLLESAQKRLQERRAQREQAQGDLSRCNEKIAFLRSEQQTQASLEQELSDKLGEWRELSAIERRVTEVRNLAKKNADLARQIEEHANISKRAAAAAEAVLESAEQAYREAKEAEAVAAKQLQQALADSGLGRDDDYAAMMLSPEQLEALERALQAYDAAVESVRQQVKRLNQELEGKDRPDVDAERTKQSQAQEAAEQAAQAVGKLEQTALAAKDSLERLQKLEEKGKKLEEKYGRTSRLSALLSGKNLRKVPLHQFVLGVMLDDILSSANQFFATLSSGRYSLSRVTAITSGNALGGLDLEVFDAYTGGARAVETLSGGELFLASLSLAFGLSDVVQSYSGGVHLDSLFIDEGFGSLDQETLDTAMKALGQLQQMGRTVGIISHVSELKSRIASQIGVGKDREGGSTVVFRSV